MARKLLMSQPSFNSYHTSKPFDVIVVNLKRRAITFVGTSSKLSPFLQWQLIENIKMIDLPFHRQNVFCTLENTIFKLPIQACKWVNLFVQTIICISIKGNIYMCERSCSGKRSCCCGWSVGWTCCWLGNLEKLTDTFLSI